MRRIVRYGPRAYAVVAVAAVLASCASVTRTSSLDSEPGRTWIQQSAGQTLVVELVGGAAISGTLVDAGARTLRLQATDPAPIEIETAPGMNLRERRRGTGAGLGVVAGIGVGAVVGVILTEALATPNQDSAGGVERPTFLVPLGALAGILIGGITGYALGAERRLELRADGSP
jgi:hypothetical protein